MDLDWTGSFQLDPFHTLRGKWGAQGARARPTSYKEKCTELNIVVSRYKKCFRLYKISNRICQCVNVSIDYIYITIVAAPQLPLAPSAERLGAVDEGILPVLVSEHTMGYASQCGTHIPFSHRPYLSIDRAKLLIQKA